MKITRLLDHEDQVITVTRSGKRITIKTERATIARAVMRQVIDSIAPEGKDRQIGFNPTEE